MMCINLYLPQLLIKPLICKLPQCIALALLIIQQSKLKTLLKKVLSNEVNNLSVCVCLSSVNDNNTVTKTYTYINVSVRMIT